MATPKGYKGKISYVSPVSAAHAEYSTANAIPLVGVAAAVKNYGAISTNSSPTFRRGGQTSAVPSSANLGLRRISETIRARKLKFYTDLHGSSTL